MKAAQDFEILTDKKGERLPQDDIPEKDRRIIKVEKGSEIPKKYLPEIVEKNLEFVDVEYKEGRPVLPKHLQFEPRPFIKPRQYDYEKLLKIFNEKGFSELKKIGKRFNVTDRSSKRLINEILRAQEENQRKGT